MMVSNGTSVIPVNSDDTKVRTNKNKVVLQQKEEKTNNDYKVKVVTGKCKVYINATTCVEYNTRVIYVGEKVAKQYLKEKKLSQQ
mmetsp:Transcript_28390/g.31404  ORF Transcript_28390/g.31404 Transcript_28390/m.31404 type:complete len:85 (+) Transcript_28390:3-257(+)